MATVSSAAAGVGAGNSQPNAFAWSTANYTPALESHELYALEGVRVKLHPLLSGEEEKFMLRYDMVTGTTQLFVANSHSEGDFTPFAGASATLPRLKEIILVTKSSPWVTRVRNDKGVTLANILEQLWHDYAVPVTEAEIAAMGRGEWAQLYRRIGRHSPRASAENYFAATGMTPPVYGTPGALPSGGSPYGAHYGLPAGGYNYPPNPYGPQAAAATATYGSLLIGATPAPQSTLFHGYGHVSPVSHSPGASGATSPANRLLALGATRRDWLVDRRIFNGLSNDPTYCESRLGFKAPNVFLLELIR
ncbi:hypothetical protein BKA62DRAFT_96915 [Auriculariales sp. MPI-PUGE-AT-0066]|nr:hypothetical protein BKA62DRAFT_96915 [Auriculariales sp. MPI-PUGE-AT-0066]